MTETAPARRRVAIIGTGVAGLTVAHRIHRDTDLTVFEADSRIGGHVNTIPVELGGKHYEVDTGFIVLNDRTYPNFEKLLAEIGVETRDSTMGFSVRCDRTKLEYSGADLGSLFARRRNALSLRFWSLLRDVLRFHKEAPGWLERGDDKPTLGDLLEQGRYGKPFIEQYLLPMGAAIWSAEPERIREFPALTFLRFFKNHGLLSVSDRPTWKTVVGGSKRYVEALIPPFEDRIRTDTPVLGVRRFADRVEIRTSEGVETFDEVVLACHSDQSLRMLEDPSESEREVLGAIHYQENEAVLHTDPAPMPRRKRAWTSWNYLVPKEPQARVAVTYCMNVLQGLESEKPLLVTLNHSGPIREDEVIRRIVYHHPIYTKGTVAAQARHGEISGVNRTHYCGAYWRNGFHEDGCWSGLRVAEALGLSERPLEVVA